MLTCVKFRPAKGGASSIISTTLGKIAVVDRAWRSPGMVPSEEVEEFWLVDVIREAQPGKAQGCFIVRPVRCIARAREDGSFDRPLLYLLPGTYSIDPIVPGPGLRPVSIVTPGEVDGQDWTLSLDAVKIIMSIRNSYAVVVNLGGSMWHHVRQPKGNGMLDPDEEPRV
jgi:hypothetical protein